MLEFCSLLPPGHAPSSQDTFSTQIALSSKQIIVTSLMPYWLIGERWAKFCGGGWSPDQTLHEQSEIQLSMFVINIIFYS